MKNCSFCLWLLFLFFLQKYWAIQSRYRRISTKVGNYYSSCNWIFNHGWCKQCSIYCQFDSLGVDSTFMSKLKGADLDKVKMAVEAYKTSGAGYRDCRQIGWSKNCMGSKSRRSYCIERWFGCRQIEGDVTAKIAELTNFITSNESQLATWKESLAKVSEGSVLHWLLKAALPAKIIRSQNANKKADPIIGVRLFLYLHYGHAVQYPGFEYGKADVN